jgi:hypothetical protein
MIEKTTQENSYSKKNQNLYKKIEQMRKNKKHRDLRPYINFYTKTGRSYRLLRKISKTVTANTLFHEALSQFVMADISAFEVYFKDIFLAIFQFHKNPKELILRCNDKKIINQSFNLEDLVRVGFDNYSIPEIILQIQSFQRLDHIKNVFTHITGKDFCSALKNRKFHKGKESEFELDDECFPKLQEYLDLRHCIVHDWSPKSDFNLKKILDLHWNMVIFVVAADEYLEREFLFENFNDSVNRNKKGSKKIKT